MEYDQLRSETQSDYVLVLLIRPATKRKDTERL